MMLPYVKLITALALLALSITYCHSAAAPNCSSSCLSPPNGLGLCTSPNTSDCCNFYHNGECVIACPAGYVSDMTFVCVRSVLHVGFERPSYVVSEDAGSSSGAVCITYSYENPPPDLQAGGLQQLPVAELRTVAIPGEAETNVDFEYHEATFFLFPGGSSECTFVFVFSDLVSEPDESFLVELNVTNHGDIEIDICRNTTVFTIIDDDSSSQPVLTATFYRPSYSFYEDVGTVPLCADLAFNFIRNEDVVLGVRVIEGTAKSGADFNISAGPFTIHGSPGLFDYICIDLTITNDNLGEGSECFFLELINLTDYRLLAQFNPIKISITDDDALPVEIRLLSDTPRIVGDSVEVNFELSRPASSVMCRLSRQPFQDCSNGSIVFTNLIPRRYTLRIEAQNLNEDPVILRRQLEISSDPQYCTLHFINGGVTVNSDQRTAVVEFVKNGPVTSFNCQLDRQGFFPCTSPLQLSNLKEGDHRVKVMPVGCGRNRRARIFDFTVQPSCSQESLSCVPLNPNQPQPA